MNSKLTRLRWELSTTWKNDWECVNIFLVFPIKKYLPKHISNAFTELGHNCICLLTRSSPITIIAVSYCSYCDFFHDAGNRILQKLFVLDKTLVLRRKSNSDRAANMTNGLKGMRLKDVRNKEFPKGRYVCIILWYHVCYSTCFKPTQFQSKISPRFGTNLYITEIYKRTILIPHCLFAFLERSLRVFVATSGFIRTNFEPDLFFFPAHITPPSGFS